MQMWTQLVLAAVLGTTVWGCPADVTHGLPSGGTHADAATGTTTDSGVADASTSAAGKKGEPCTRDSDCAELEARCRSGNLCTGSLVGDPFERECGRGGASDCPGLNCIGLKPNKQNKMGICSLPCATTEDCGPEGVCVAIAGRMQCLAPCTSDLDCANGFVCVDNPMGGGKGCFVEPP